MKEGAFSITELPMDGVNVLLASGDLDIASAPSLCERLAQRRGQRVVLDLSEASFCDMGGLRAIAEESRAGRAAGGLFAVVAPSGCPARRLLELAKVHEFVEVHDDRPRAIARVRPIR